MIAYTVIATTHELTTGPKGYPPATVIGAYTDKAEAEKVAREAEATGPVDEMDAPILLDDGLTWMPGEKVRELREAGEDPYDFVDYYGIVYVVTVVEVEVK